MPFPVAESLVAAAEARLGRRLPDTHRRRLLEENGGEIRASGETWWLFPVWDPTNKKTMARTASHILRENEMLRREWPDVLPAGYLTIAENGGGDYLVLAPEADAIAYWDHETGEIAAVDVDWRRFDRQRPRT